VACKPWWSKWEATLEHQKIWWACLKVMTISKLNVLNKIRTLLHCGKKTRCNQKDRE
jgi:hypothetical protein